MKKIPLTRGKYAIVDDDDYDFLMQWKWRYHKHNFKKNEHYAVRSMWVRDQLNNRISVTFWMHRVINKTPKGMLTDHINGDGLDNRKSNLRSCTISQNAVNSSIRKDNISGYRGVFFIPRTGKWDASIQSNKKRYYIGSYKTKKEAVKAYKQKSKELFGEFSRA